MEGEAGCRPRNFDALIVNIGTELTLGVTLNTNGSWLARRLTQLGFNVKKIVAVRDEERDVVEVMLEGLDRYGLIVTTGGLGPTYDDNTGRFVAKALGLELRLNQIALDMVMRAHKRRGEDLNEARIKQAYMPERAIPLENDVGTAPGFFLCSESGIAIISLPGPPKEMQAMFDERVYPLLRGITGFKYVEDFMLVRGITESTIADIIERAAKRHPSVYVKTHPTSDELGRPVIKIQLSCFTDEAERGREEIDKVKRHLENELKERVAQ